MPVGKCWANVFPQFSVCANIRAGYRMLQAGHWCSKLALIYRRDCGFNSDNLIRETGNKSLVLETMNRFEKNLHINIMFSNSGTSFSASIKSTQFLLPQTTILKKTQRERCARPYYFTWLTNMSLFLLIFSIFLLPIFSFFSPGTKLRYLRMIIFYSIFIPIKVQVSNDIKTSVALQRYPMTVSNFFI